MQPYDLYIVSKIAGGEIIKVDFYPPRVQFGIYYCQVEEIISLCRPDLLPPL